MTTPDMPVPLHAVPHEAIESFHDERDSILSAVYERLRADRDLRTRLAGGAESRIARESAKILAENIYVCLKYRLPDALTEYITWLRVYLASRSMPELFLPRLLQALQMACVAFLPSSAADSMGALLHELRARECASVKEVGV